MKTVVILIIAALLLLVFASSSTATIHVDSGSPCHRFEAIADFATSIDTSLLDRDHQQQLCKVPLFMIANPDRCPDRNWTHVATQLRCDTANEGGLLTTDGIDVKQS